MFLLQNSIYWRTRGVPKKIRRPPTLFQNTEIKARFNQSPPDNNNTQRELTAHWIKFNCRWLPFKSKKQRRIGFANRRHFTITTHKKRTTAHWIKFNRRRCPTHKRNENRYYRIGSHRLNAHKKYTRRESPELWNRVRVRRKIYRPREVRGAEGV